MKQLTIKLGILLTILGISVAQTSFIAFAEETTSQNTPTSNNFDLLPVFESTTGGKKIDLVKALPKASWEITLGSIITTLLNICGALTLLSLTVGGIFMITSQGNPDSIEKGKKIIIYSLGGLLVIAVSYAIVLGVSRLEFFTPGTGGTTQNSGTGIQTPEPAAAPTNGNGAVGGPAGAPAAKK